MDKRQEMYCRYRADGHNKTQAAMAAGYTDNARSAAVTGSRLDKDPLIQAEIKRLREKGGQHAPGIVEAPPTQPESLAAGVMPPTEEERLTRQFLIETALRNLAMAMGDLDVPVSKLLSYEDDNGKVQWKVDIKYIREREPNAAVATLKFLDDQLAKLPKEIVPLNGHTREFLEGMAAEKAKELYDLLPKVNTKVNGKGANGNGKMKVPA